MSSSSLALALVLVVTLTGELPLASSSRDLIGAATHGAREDHLLMMGRFHGWMAKHGRSYATADEKLRRFDIYRRNVEFIKAANRDGRLTYTLGENLFTDLTHEEFLAMYAGNGIAPSDLRGEKVITTRAGDVDEGSCPSVSMNLPPRFDWREQGMVTPVKRQGSCGSCWAFTAVATIESAYAIAKGVAPPVLSEQELIDCDRDDDNRGCKSGYTEEAYVWVAGHGGITSEATYPYREDDDGECQAGNLKKPVATIRDYGSVRGSCEQDLMAAVVARPVAVQFSLEECFQHYQRGIYEGACIKDGEYIGPCPSGPRHHSLTIVGYDDVGKYWIAKNSWSTLWGTEGYVLLKKDVDSPEGLCGLAVKPIYPIV